jgi:hypothetical protein
MKIRSVTLRLRAIWLIDCLTRSSLLLTKPKVTAAMQNVIPEATRSRAAVGGWLSPAGPRGPDYMNDDLLVFRPGTRFGDVNATALLGTETMFRHHSQFFR